MNSEAVEEFSNTDMDLHSNYASVMKSYYERRLGNHHDRNDYVVFIKFIKLEGASN